MGRVVEFESTFSRYRNFIKPGTWKETGELGGGLTYNIGSLIDQAVRLLDYRKPYMLIWELQNFPAGWSMIIL
ncbi:MAG: hypothetical protein R2738_06550 [Bacteroides graminisolvens]